MKKFYHLIFIIFVFLSSLAYSQEWPFDEPLPAEEKAVLDEAKKMGEQGDYEGMKNALDYFESHRDSVYSKQIEKFMAQSKKLPSEVKKGLKLLNKGEYQKALKTFNKFLDKNPGNLSALTHRAMVLAVLTPKEAVEECDRLLYYLPKIPQLFATRGDANHKLGDKEKAIRDFSLCLSMSPSENIYRERSLVYYKLGRYEDSLADISEAIKLNSENVQFYLDRAAIYCAISDMEKAETDCNTYIKKGGKSGMAYRTLVVINVNNKKYEKALEYCNKLLGLDANISESYYLRGGVYFHLNDFQKSLKDLDSAIKIFAKYSLAYSLRSEVFGKLGDTKSALENAEDAVKYASTYMESGFAYKARGLANLSAKQNEKALADFEKAMQYASSDDEKQEIQELIQQAQDS